MTPEDVIDVLSKAGAYDNRTIGQVEVVAWHEVIGRYDRDEALDAVARHYGESRDRMMPADLIQHIKAIRNERRAHHEALALPGRYETDEERDERNKAAAKRIRDEIIAPLLARMAIPPAPRIPAGVWWDDADARERHAAAALAAGRPKPFTEEK